MFRHTVLYILATFLLLGCQKNIFERNKEKAEATIEGIGAWKTKYCTFYYAEIDQEHVTIRMSRLAKDITLEKMYFENIPLHSVIEYEDQTVILNIIEGGDALIGRYLLDTTYLDNSIEITEMDSDTSILEGTFNLRLVKDYNQLQDENNIPDTILVEGGAFSAVKTD